jgi:hypothetical protein
MVSPPVAVRSAAEALLAEMGPLVARMLDRLREEAGEFDTVAHPELAEALRRSCEGNLREALETLAGDRDPPRVPPPEAIAEARLSARAGMSLEALLHTYRVGHATALEALLDAIEDAGLPQDARRAAMRLATSYTFAYVDAVTDLVTQTYARERERLVHSRAQRRMQLVRDLLDGQQVDAGELGYEPRGANVAVVVEGAGGDALIAGLATEAREALSVSLSPALHWAWLSVGDRFSAARLLDGGVEPHTAVGVGRCAQGAAGFRSSHREAGLAVRVALRLGRRVAAYDDVALEAQALAAERAARDFVAAELGPLVGDEPRTVKLRTTLAAYLTTSLNASSAAALLAVNDRTVAYRMRLVEELLGRPIGPRATELSVAVRWHELLQVA